MNSGAPDGLAEPTLLVVQLSVNEHNCMNSGLINKSYTNIFFQFIFQSSIVRDQELHASAKQFADRGMKIVCVPFGSANTDVSSKLEWYFVLIYFHACQNIQMIRRIEPTKCKLVFMYDEYHC